ncbi:MAG: hypothetical protein WCN92_02945 [Eubacteriales bacterium]
MKYFWVVPLFILLWIVFDVVRNLFNKPVKSSIPKPPNLEGEILARLSRGEDIPVEELMEMLETSFIKINNRFDCADFFLTSLIRMYLQFGDKLPSPARDKIKDTMLNFKYWMDEPGKDSMCYWSENHQILFAETEYLAGQTFPDEIFTNDGKSGKEHMAKAKKRVEAWMELRFAYGFSEWYSPVYYGCDLAGISNFVEFAKDEKLKLQMNMILDVFWFDVATHSLKGAFTSTSGRMFAHSKLSSDKGNSLSDAITFLWPECPVGNPENCTSMLTNFLLNREYKLPTAIRNIMFDETEQIILASNGVSVWEMKDEGLIGQENKQIMIQLGKEAFTSPEIIANSLAYFSKNRMFSNKFFHPIGFVNILFFRLLGLTGPISKLVKSPSDTVALNRANVYTYRTKNYIIATAQQYGTDTCAYQHHIFSATLDRTISLFTTWPSRISDSGSPPSPSFFMGSFRFPHAFQHKNIAVMLYDLTIKKHIAEKKPLDYTHAYFPTELMDEHIVEGNFAFCKKGETYAAIIGASKLEFGQLRDEKTGNYNLTQPYELKQYGKRQFWVFELSSKDEDGSFEKFIERVKSNALSFDADAQKLSYSSNGDKIFLTYKEKAAVNGQIINTEYKRFDSVYSATDRKAEEIRIVCGGATLTLNQNKLIRKEELIQK